MVVPNHVQIPFMRQQGDVHLDAEIGTSGLAGEAAVSPIQNIAIKGGYSKAWSRQEKDYNGKLIQVTHGHALTELALGYYLPKFRAQAQDATIQIFGGLTQGTVTGDADVSIFSRTVRIVDSRQSNGLLN
jgi:hypothetical protein